MELRSYQAEAVERAFACWAAGKRSTLFVCPTGGGKTLVFAEIVRRHLEEGGRRVLVVADREWLITQAWDVIAAQADVEVGIEMGTQRVDRILLPHVVCASIQSLVRRFHDFDADAFDLIVIDEADLALAPSYRRVVDYFVGARIFGCTATPDRGDGVALGDMFEDTCGDVDIRDLIDAGYLCTVRQHTVRVLDLSRVRTGSGGDLDEASLELILTEERHLHEVVKPTMELAGDRPTLVFATTVRHAELLAALFNRYRLGSARAISGKTGPMDRIELRRAFVAREFQYLCNCNLVTRGVDIPPIACVAMARPTQSRTVYVQGIGRGTRLSDDKEDLLVLDFTDGATTFSLVNVVDVLGGRVTVEERERAKEIVDEQPGADVSVALAQAREDLKDAEVRARVLAKVKFKTREVAVHEPIDWSQQPLGEMSDQQLAERIGVPKEAVWYARRRLGIPSYASTYVYTIDWTKQPLGKEKDCDIAKRLGVESSRVSAARIRLGIPSLIGVQRRIANDIANSIDWSKVDLGKRSDTEIASELGIRSQTVLKARKHLNIPAHGIQWDIERLKNESPKALAEEMGLSVSGVQAARKRFGLPSRKAGRAEREIDENDVALLLGTTTDAELVRMFKVSPHRIRRIRRDNNVPSSSKYRTVDWDAQPLGKQADMTLARALGVSTTAVHTARTKRGIPKFTRNNINWDKQPLGKVPDYKLARQLGVSGTSVGREREKRGIESCPRSEIDRKGFRDLVGKISDKEIAERTGESVRTVRGYRNQHGIKLEK